jgi:hypothetical protein
LRSPHRNERLGLPLLVATHQLGINFFYFLCDQPKLWDALRINLLLVAEGDRLESENCFIERAYLSALSGVAVGIAYVRGRLTNNGHVTTDYDQVIRRNSCICIRQGCVGTTRTLKPYVPLSEAGTAPW